MRRVVVLLLFLSCATAEIASLEAAPPRKRSASKSKPSSMLMLPDPTPSHEQQLERTRAEAERYKGLTIDSEDSRAARILEKTDFVPQERMDRFKWIQQFPGTVITGWYGHIIESTPDKGGMFVKLKVTPKHDGNPSFHTNDYTLETYYVSRSGVRHIETVGSSEPVIATVN